jgi:hypothetical protein
MSGKKVASPVTWSTSEGRVIGEAEAARLTEDFKLDDSALNGAEVTIPRKAGRPSLAGAMGTSPQVTFRLSATERERAERVAADRGTTVSALAREALEQFVKKVG